MSYMHKNTVFETDYSVLVTGIASVIDLSWGCTICLYRKYEFRLFDI